MTEGTSVQTFNTASPAEVAQHRGAGVEALVTRAAQEIQAMAVLAKRFPRDADLAYARIMNACRRKSLAEVATYEYSRGGEKVDGPSIRMAEVLAREWGNLDYGIMQLEQRDDKSVMLAYCWDLETNVRQTREFYVPHERKAKGFIKKLDDPRDVYELTANMGARRLRACILGIIPGDIVEAAVKECDKTLIGANPEPLGDRIRNMVDKFLTDFQVTKEMLEKLIGLPTARFSEKDVLRLGKVYNAIKDGVSKREDVFEGFKLPAAEAGETTNTEAMFKAAQAASAGAGQTAEQGGMFDGNGGAGAKADKR